MSTSEEVSLKLLLLDGSNYTSWSASVLDVFRTMGPQIEQIVDVSISPPHDDLIYLSREEVKCLQLNAQAANVLFSALSEDVLDAVIFGDGKPPNVKRATSHWKNHLRNAQLHRQMMSLQ